MAFTLPPLPYGRQDLEPLISAETLDFHYGKHHQTYVTNLNKLLEDSPIKDLSLEEIITKTAVTKSQQGIFNNAAQVWNHTFYWNCMKPKGGGLPQGTLMDAIVRDFGTYDHFKDAFKQAALTQFGSGWAWLALRDGKLEIMKTANADLPMTHGAKALLTLDVWEHAYYLDYQNRRADYVDVFLQDLVNWSHVQDQLNDR